MRAKLMVVVLGVALAACKSENKFKQMADSANQARDAGESVQPQPPTATLIAWGQNTPRDLWVDDDGLYWLNEGRRVDGSPGIYRVNKSGGEVTALSKSSSVYAIAVDASSVYWIDPQNDRVVKVPKNGGAETVLVQDVPNLRALALDDTHVYFGGNDWLGRVAKGGGKLELLHENVQMPDLLVVGQGSLYWYSSMSGKVARTGTRGGAAKAFYANDQNTLAAMFLDGADLFLSWGSEKKMEVNRLPLSGGKPTPVVTGQDPAVDFAIDGDAIYWGTSDTISKVSRSGGSATQVVEGIDRLSDLAVDGAFVYWTDRIGRVQKLPK